MQGLSWNNAGNRFSRASAGLFFAILALPSIAAELPLTGIYGTPIGCQQFAAGGREGVIYNVPVSPGEDFGLVVTSKEMIEQESVCTPLTDKLGIVDFSCNGGDLEFSVQIMLSLNPSTDVLSLTYEDGTLELHRCPTDDNTTVPIDGAFCSHGLDSEGFPSAEFKIDANGYYESYFASSPSCEITKVEDIGDGGVVVEDACGESFDLKVQGDTATVFLADGHAYALKRCK
jgi:hypothetical protein